jgi:hypothetical protein
MHPAIRDLLERQLRGGFQDVRGSTAHVTVPISDRLINEAIAAFLPEGGKVREVLIESHDGNRLTARIRTGSSLLPAIPVGLEIDKQPSLPADPTLVLKLAHASKFVTIAASALPGMVKLPPGITIAGDRIGVDIRRLLVERQLDSWLAYVTDVRVETREGAAVLHVALSIGPACP